MLATTQNARVAAVPVVPILDIPTTPIPGLSSTPIPWRIVVPLDRTVLDPLLYVSVHVVKPQSCSAELEPTGTVPTGCAPPGL